MVLAMAPTDQPVAAAPPKPAVQPGPIWLWFSAWSLQGTGVFLVGALDVEPGLTQFLLTGLVAAVPLVGLYLLLRRLGQSVEKSR